MRIATRLLTAAFLAASGPVAFAGEHLVSGDAARGRLTEAASARAADLSTIDAALSRPEAARAAASLGVDVQRVQRAAATLSDAELRDLATRAASLSQEDPRAGLTHDVDELLVIFLIVAIVVLVIKAVD